MHEQLQQNMNYSVRNGENVVVVLLTPRFEKESISFLIIVMNLQRFF